jgi:hypothetical protein
MKQMRPKQAYGQSWKTFLRNHAEEVSGEKMIYFLRAFS